MLPLDPFKKPHDVHQSGLKLFCLAAVLLLAAAAAPAPDTAVLDLGARVFLRLAPIRAGEFVMGESHLNRSDTATSRLMS